MGATERKKETIVWTRGATRGIEKYLKTRRRKSTKGDGVKK